jgi:myo-inositol-1(or 4)-monophosphatase
VLAVGDLLDVDVAGARHAGLDSALVLTGFSYHADVRGHQGEVVQRLLSRVRDIRCPGSSALELCWVACGRSDAYFQRGTEIWDRAAGALIAAEAGARTELPCPENGDMVMAAAPAVFDALWGVVQGVAV